MKDIKTGYEYINLANARHRDVPSMRDFKRALREYLREIDDPYRRIIKSDCDECIELVVLGTDTGETEAEADAYFRETEFIPMHYTGKLFTDWYKIFKRSGMWMAYHCICRGV